MRTSFLSRSVIAVASLAIGSVALAATPATATPREVVTRDLVLAVAQQTPSNPPSPEMTRLISLACHFDSAGGDTLRYVYSAPLVTGNADGVVVTANLNEPSAEDDTPGRWCTFAAVASTDPAFALSGNAVVTVTGYEYTRRADSPTEAVTTPLSGNLVVTTPINRDYPDFRGVSLAVTGAATGPVSTTATQSLKFMKPRTKATEKAAKAKYDKRLAAAKKWYTKALAKAGSSTSKKSAAKKAYAAKKAAYKKAYEKRYFGVKFVTTTTTQTVSRPFNATVSYDTQLG